MTEIKLSARKKKLIQRFHIELKQNGMIKQKPDILESFGVKSTRDLSEEELQHAVDNLTGEADKWRKRLIAAIFGWCRSINYQADIDKVKAIACRASGYDNFNKIPVSRLRDLYYGWIKKSRTRVGVAEFKEQVLNHLEACN
jgi:hypothetical protein